MKNIFYLFAFAGFLLATSCGGEATESEGAPQTLDAARKVLQEKRKELQILKKEIAKAEAAVVKLDPKSKKKSAIPVTIAKVEVKEFNHYVEVQGNVVPSQEPGMASSETGGRIVDMTVKEGDYVKKGALIAKVDLESIKKSIAQLDESLSLAQNMYKRQENLWNQKLVLRCSIYRLKVK